MIFSDIIKSTALMVNREDVVHYINYETYLTGDDTSLTINLMTNLLNLVIRELAGTFIPMTKREKIEISDNKIRFGKLTERCLKISGVFNDEGEKINYSITPEFIAVQGTSAIVEYEYSPPNYSLNNVIGYSEKDISEAALCYGLASEYCICKGAFDEAVMWHKRYVESVNAVRKITNAKLKARSWE